MLVIGHERAWTMTEGQARGLLRIVAALVPEGTVYAVERGSTVRLVKEPAESAEGYEADGWTVHRS